MEDNNLIINNNEELQLLEKNEENKDKVIYFI